MPINSGDLITYDGTQWTNQKSVAGPFDVDSPTFHVDSATHQVGMGTTSPNSKLHVTGALATALTSVSSSPYTVTASDSYLRVDSGSGNITLNLPTAVGIAGRRYAIKKVSVANTVTVTPYGSETINFSASWPLTVQYSAIVIVSDGANWQFTGQN